MQQITQYKNDAEDDTDEGPVSWEGGLLRRLVGRQGRVIQLHLYQVGDPNSKSEFTNLYFMIEVSPNVNIKDLL